MTTNQDDGFIKAGGTGTSKMWDKEGTITGTYMRKRENVGPNQSNVYELLVEGDDEPTGVWGSTVLDGDSGFENIPLLSIVRIKCLGKPQGKNYTVYDVEYKPPTTVDVETGKDLPDPEKV